MYVEETSRKLQYLVTSYREHIYFLVTYIPTYRKLNNFPDWTEV